MMKNLIKINLIAMFWIILSVTSCGSETLSILKLKERRLIICKDKPGLCWPHKICKKKNWYSKEECHWDDGYLDLNDPEIRQRLIDLGFTATTNDRFDIPR